MQELDPLIVDDMAIQEERIKGLETQTGNIRERLSKVEGRLDVPSKPISPALITLLSIVGLAIIAYGSWLGTQVVSHGEKLTAILSMLAPQAILNTLSSAVSAEPREAKDELTQVTTTIRQLQQAKLKLPQKTANETSEQLTKVADAHQDLTETWSAIGEFITYRSQVIQSWEKIDLPACTDQLLQWHVEGITPHPDDPTKSDMTHGPFEVHDCKIILDSPDTTRWMSLALSLADIDLRHCAVFYTGGPIILVPVKVATEQPPKIIGKMNFENCLFVFTLARVPTPEGQSLARTLLMATSGTVQFKPDIG